MHAHPRKTTHPGFLFMRLAVSLAFVMLAFLAAGTVYAQSALPGETFYAWKLASENVWRAVSPDPLGVDLALAERRMNELMAVGEDPSLQAQTLDAYLEVTSRLRLQMNATNEERILSVLDSRQRNYISKASCLSYQTRTSFHRSQNPAQSLQQLLSRF